MTTKDNTQDVQGVVERLKCIAAVMGSFTATKLTEAASLLLSEHEGRVRAEALLNAPELHDFAAGVVLEAAHQRERWAAIHDAGKEPQDWFWLLGYLGGKALKSAASGDRDKALHHCISSAAALANWHAHLLGADTSMRPGIDPVERGIHDAPH